MLKSNAALKGIAWFMTWISAVLTWAEYIKLQVQVLTLIVSKNKLLVYKIMTLQVVEFELKDFSIFCKTKSPIQHRANFDIHNKKPISKAKIVCVPSQKWWEALGTLRLPFCRIYRDGKRVILQVKRANCRRENICFLLTNATESTTERCDGTNTR